MERRKRLYLLLGLITGVFLVAAALPFYPTEVRAIFAIPAVGGFAAIVIQLLRDEISHQNDLMRDQISQQNALLRDAIGHNYELIRDEIAHQRSLELQGKDQNFTLGAASHMAQTVFDRQVQFCQDYIALINEIDKTFLQFGASEKVMPIARNLEDLRKKNIAWISRDASEKLERFEFALSKMGSMDDMIRNQNGLSRDEAADWTDKKWQIYRQLTGLEHSPNDVDGIHVPAIVAHLRTLLGIDSLVSLREIAIEDALKRLNGRE